MKSFSFNLLPGKSKALVKKEENRDNYSIFSAVLPLIGVIIWLAVIVFNNYVVEGTKHNWEKAINDRKQIIEKQYLDVLIRNGELVIKTNALAEVISKDIQPEQLFILVQTLFPIPDDGFSIMGYGRDNNGSFNVTVRTFSYTRFAEITRRFSNYEKIRNVYIPSVSYDPSTNSYLGTINFFFKETEISSATNS